ncbi:trigger factor [Natranaerovirga pectinivora]|uniref:Trigger factor n=1 Tax=Natranaerovirga pectinivora TaxID=682400 RepID=A0A4R3MK43_9FIRM|nr:trigger factor [Natranaerovirga pectinivora]TCT14655.1 trigger factor [Natranaerovirga pectinivora]
MNSKVENLEKSMVKLTIEVDANRFEEGLNEAFKKNKSKMAVPGFRKGKVPRALIEKTYGSGVFYEDAANYLIPDAYDKAIAESGLDIVSRPEIDVVQIEKGKPFIFTATVAVKPEVELGEYKGLEVEKEEIDIQDEAITEEIEKVREQNSRLISITDRPVKVNDQVVINFEGFVDGVPFEGGKAEDYPLVIGSHSFIDTFEDQLVGKNIGDDIEVNVTFPESYQKEELQGKPAMFKVQINEIKEKELPVVDDEFAKDVSEFDTLNEYKEDIKAKLKEQKENEAKIKKQEAVITKVIENSNMEVPEPMVEMQVEQMIQDFEQRLRYQGLELDQYLQMVGQNRVSFGAQFRTEAEKRVKTRLVLEAVAKVENIQISDEEVTNEIGKMAEMYKMEVDKLKEMITGHEVEHMKEDMAVQKALDLIVEASKEV